MAPGGLQRYARGRVPCGRPAPAGKVLRLPHAAPTAARSSWPAQLPDFWKMHGIHPRWTRYRHVRVCFPRDSGR